MLNYEFPPIGGGGGQAHLCLLKEYAERDGLAVDVLTSAPKPGFVVETLAQNVRIHKVGIDKEHLHFWRKREVVQWLSRAKSHYRTLLRDNAYDLVHAFFGFPSGWLCYRTAEKLPYMISLRGSDVPGDNARLQLDYKILGPLVFKPIWKRASAIVACSEGLKTRALRFLPTAKIDVIPNGVDTERFAPIQSPRTPGAIRLLTVGRLSVTKRVPLLIEMVELLNRQGLKVHLTIIGGGSLESELRQILEAKDLRGLVTLQGRIEANAMPELYRSHDLFVSATAQEGMSNAMLEAMASGLPIVTTRCEGVDELIDGNGLVVDETTAAALAEVVTSLIKDKSKRQAMSVAAREKAEQFTWGAGASRYLELYNRVAGRG